jgi:hypothetical protein
VTRFRRFKAHQTLGESVSLPEVMMKVLKST